MSKHLINPIRSVLRRIDPLPTLGIFGACLALAIVVSLLWLPGAAHATNPVAAPLRQSAPPERELDRLPILSAEPLGEKADTWSVATGDLNGDGAIDIVTGGGFYSGLGPNRIYFNDGRGRFGGRDLVREFAPPSGATTVVLADMNGDGILDIVAGHWDRQGGVFINDGSGGVADVRPFGPDAGRTTSLAVGDLNGDGALDVVVGSYCDVENPVDCIPDQAFFNDGAGNLGGENNAQNLGTGEAHFTSSLTLVDLNQDGSLDIIGGYAGASNQIYWNDGAGGFSPENATAYGGAGWAGYIAVGDVNGDGAVDLVDTSQEPDTVYLNDRTSSLSAGQELNSELYTDVVAGVLVDVNGDGWLDLVAGAGNTEAPEDNLLFLNDGSGRFLEPLAFGSPNSSSAVAVADLNGDGVLDIVVGNFQDAQTWVYLRKAQGHFSAPSDFGEPANTTGVLLGDLDRNGILDILIAGGRGQDHVAYLNDGVCMLDLSCQSVTFGPGQSDQAGAWSYSLALGDLNGDTYLDVVEGREGQSVIYWNLATASFSGFSSPVPFGPGETRTRGLAIGDLNGDGYLDIVEGNEGQDYVLLNDGQGVFATSSAFAFGPAESTADLALGDLDQDGHLDIVAGFDGENRIFLNHGDGISFAEQSFGPADATASIALADLNADGRLDIIVANMFSDRHQVYLSDGAGGFATGDPFGGFQFAKDVVAIDLDGDGDHDLVVGHRKDTEIYLNDGSGSFGEADRVDRDYRYGTTGIALGDLDRDGLPELVTSRGEGWALQDRIRWNRVRSASGLASAGPRVTTGYPGVTAATALGYPAQILSSQFITVPYTLFDGGGDTAGRVAVSFSLDGGGQWLPASAREGTETTHLATSPSGEAHTFVWDTLATGVYGRSDQVVLRFQVYPQPRRAAQVGDYRYALPAPGHWPSAPATTLPFRVQGSQVWVGDENGRAIAGAYVYRLAAGQATGARLMPEPANPLATDVLGYLPGRGLLATGDRLVAVLPVVADPPIEFTKQYHLYHTSAAPTVEGLEMDIVTTSGVIELTIPNGSPERANTLILFDLVMSLEWDASGDDLFMLELEESIRLASELLYDVTNGQAAIGQVQVFPAKTYWNRADVVVYASNSLRPSAAIGGVVDQPVSDLVRPAYGQPPDELAEKAYVPGQIRMGTAWDPFGESATDLGEQWWRALAHELAHHLLFLPDNYVGLKPDDPDKPGGKRFLGRIDCQGSFMTTTRDPSYTEFLTELEWRADCIQSLAENTTGRTDWETISLFYPMLKAPAGLFEGPTVLPLEVTSVVPWILLEGRETLPARNFDLRDDKGNRIRLPNAQVYLFQRQGNDDPTDDVLIGLGSPTAGGDRVKVRGAYPGDRLCLFDFSYTDRTYAGCIESMTGAQVSIPVSALEAEEAVALWAPAIDVQAVTTRTLQITVNQDLAGIVLTPDPAGSDSEIGAAQEPAQLRVQVFPAHFPSVPGLAPTATLELVMDHTYQAEIQLPYPASDVAVRIWLDDGGKREAVSRFFLQLPWKEGETVTAGPDHPVVGGPDRPVVGGLERPVVGGVDRPVVAGPDRPVVGGVDRPVVAGPDRPVVGGLDRPVVGGVDRPVVAGPDRPVVGGPDYPVVGGVDRPVVAGPDRPVVGGIDHPVVGGAPRREMSAPVLSTDSQVVIYDQGGLFEPSGIQSLQILPALPGLSRQPWLMPVGQAYAVEPDPTVISERTIAFNYLQRDVPEGYEHTLAIYFLAAAGEAWERLETRQFVENLVVADLQQGAGAYAVMATVTLPELHPGWNLFAYPLPDARPVDVALESIAGKYATVYEPAPDATDLLAFLAQLPSGTGLADQGMEQWLANLQTNVERLQFGHIYLINIVVDEMVTPLLAPPRRSPDGVVPGSD